MIVALESASLVAGSGTRTLMIHKTNVAKMSPTVVNFAIFVSLEV